MTMIQRRHRLIKDRGRVTVFLSSTKIEWEKKKTTKQHEPDIRHRNAAGFNHGWFHDCSLANISMISEINTLTCKYVVTLIYVCWLPVKVRLWLGISHQNVFSTLIYIYIFFVNFHFRLWFVALDADNGLVCLFQPFRFVIWLFFFSASDEMESRRDFQKSFSAGKRLRWQLDGQRNDAKNMRPRKTRTNYKWNENEVSKVTVMTSRIGIAGLWHHALPVAKSNRPILPPRFLKNKRKRKKYS